MAKARHGLYRFSSLIDWTLLFIAIATIALAMAERSFVFDCCGPHGLLAASIVSLIACYLIISRSLRLQGCPPLMRIVIGALNTLAAIYMFEIISGASYLKLVDVYYATYELPFLNGLFPNDNPLALLSGFGMVVLFLLSGYQFMHRNKWILINAGVIVSIFLVWITLGYPQYYVDGNYQQVAYFLNTVAKFPVALFPATLYIKH